MRVLPTQIEQLPPAPFILGVSLAGGVLQGIPGFFLEHTDGTGARVAQLVVAVGISVVWWAAAVLLWWTTVRRRQFSIWKTAWHVTLALALADVLGLALGYVSASIETHGAFVEALVHAPLSASTSGLSFIVLIRSPIRFLGAAMVIALGRRLPGSGGLVDHRPLASADPEAVA
jgi:hypothetical protein